MNKFNWRDYPDREPWRHGIRRERLYHISGTGWFFSDFYVMAESPRHAAARASDILHAQLRAQSGKYQKTSALDQIVSIKVVPN